MLLRPDHYNDKCIRTNSSPTILITSCNDAVAPNSDDCGDATSIIVIDNKNGGTTIGSYSYKSSALVAGGQLHSGSWRYEDRQDGRRFQTIPCGWSIMHMWDDIGTSLLVIQMSLCRTMFIRKCIKILFLKKVFLLDNVFFIFWNNYNDGILFIMNERSLRQKQLKCVCTVWAMVYRQQIQHGKKKTYSIFEIKKEVWDNMVQEEAIPQIIIS